MLSGADRSGEGGGEDQYSQCPELCEKGNRNPGM